MIEPTVQISTYTQQTPPLCTAAPDFTYVYQNAYRRHLYASIQKLTRDLEYFNDRYFTKKIRESVSKQLDHIIDVTDKITHRYASYYKKRKEEYTKHIQTLDQLLPYLRELVDIFWSKPEWDANYHELVYKKYKKDIDDSWVTEKDFEIYIDKNEHVFVFNDINGDCIIQRNSINF
jgi:hypothetical protein